MAVGIRQPAAVLKMRIFHTESCRPLVHQIDKFLLASRHIFCSRHRRIIAGSYCDALDQRIQCLDLSLLQKHLRTAHGLCVRRSAHLIFQFNLTILQIIKNNEQRHYFCNTGRTSLLIGILFVDDLPCGSLYHDR